MMRWFLCLPVVFAQVAEAAPLHVETRTIERSREALTNRSAGPSGTIEMPWITSSDSRLAARINEAVYLEILGVPPPRSPGKTFTPPQSMQLDAVHSISFVIARNDNRIFAIDISQELCGAYCEADQRELSFDARTGRALNLSALVTSDGIKQLEKAMTSERKRRYAAEIKSLTAALAARASSSSNSATRPPDGTDNGVDDLEARLSLNQECLEREERESAALYRERRVLYSHFRLPKSEAMILVSERCSNHAMRALDDVGDVALTVPPEELAPLLSTYGKAVVLGRDVTTEASLFGQVLHGQIGKSRITIRLEVPSHDGSMSGLYYYEKYRKPIELRGSLDGSHLTLTEGIDTSHAQFDLSVRANGLIGRWRDGKRELPVTFGW